MHHKGAARVFDCEEDALSAIYDGKINPGEVVVIRYEGPKGGPGMREMLNPTSAIMGSGLATVLLLSQTVVSQAQQEVQLSVMYLPRQQSAVRLHLLKRAI